jgi:hypothetical protein
MRNLVYGDSSRLPEALFGPIHSVLRASTDRGKQQARRAIHYWDFLSRYIWNRPSQLSTMATQGTAKRAIATMRHISRHVQSVVVLRMTWGV